MVQGVQSSIGKLFDSLLSYSQIETAWMVGSATNNPEENSDIDLLLLFNSYDMNKHATKIEALLRNRFSRISFDYSDDSIICSLKDTPKVGIALHLRSDVVLKVKQYAAGVNLDGLHKTWAAGYWMPEALCADIAFSQLISSSKETDSYLKEIVLPYPQKMSEAICNLCKEEIQCKLSRLTNKVSPIELSILLMDIVSAIIRYTFAKDRYYLRGFKRIDLQKNLLSSSSRKLIGLAEKLTQNNQLSTEILKIRKEILQCVI